MNTGDMVVIEEFCQSHELEISFIRSLEDVGLIQTTILDQVSYLPADELTKLEKLVRLHRDLEINLEGIDAITSLLERMEAMQDELTRLRNRLKFFEEYNR